MKVEHGEKDRREKSELMIPNTAKTGSGDRRLDGSMAMTQLQTPITQSKLISAEERRRIIRRIRGILNSGIIMPLSIPMT